MVLEESLEALDKFAIDKYNKLSKATFNALENVDLKAAGKEKSFEKGVVTLMQQVGIPDKFLHGISGEEVGSEDWLDTFRSLAVEAEDIATDSAIGGLLMAVGLGEFAPMAETVVVKFRSSYRESVLKKGQAKAKLIQPGTWVYINNGHIGNVPGWKDELRRRRRLWGAPPPEDHITIGFYIGLNNKAGYVNVFNFDVFREQRAAIEDVTVVPKAKSVELDTDTILSGIRALKFVPPPQPLMESSVPTDPGAEVIMNDELYHVVTSEGGFALIEDEHGQRYSTSIDKLKPGRQKHTNSWNYRKGQPFLTGFNPDQQAPIYSGQWVWVKARPELVANGTTNHELAVVWKVSPEGIHGFQAIDGEEGTVVTVWPLDPDLEDALNMDKRFLRFRRESCEGGDTATHNMGQYDLPLCIGRSNDANMKMPTSLTPGESVQTAITHPEATVGDGGARGAVDAQVEASRALGTQPAVFNKESGYVPAADAVDGGNSLFAYGVMTVAALLLWNSVDVNLDIFGSLGLT